MVYFLLLRQGRVGCAFTSLSSQREVSECPKHNIGLSAHTTEIQQQGGA
jgi:hypothetical protein